MTRRAVCWAATGALSLGVVTTAMARPQYLAAFKANYKTAQGKPTLNAANCSLCHIGAPPQRQFNVWGSAVLKALGANNVQDQAKIVAAFQAAEGGKNPVANQTFAQLIAADKQPGQAAGSGGGGNVAGATGEWMPLYTGVNTDNWTKMNSGNWMVQDYILKYTGGGNGWLRSNQKFRNYSAVIVWRWTQPGSSNDSGIFLKAANEGGSPWPNSPQLNMGPGDNIGSIGGAQGTRNRPDLIKQNDWNTFQITVKDGHATLLINNQKAWDEATGLPTEPGYVGIECEGPQFQVAQFWIMPLP